MVALSDAESIFFDNVTPLMVSDIPGQHKTSWQHKLDSTEKGEISKLSGKRWEDRNKSCGKCLEGVRYIQNTSYKIYKELIKYRLKNMIKIYLNIKLIKNNNKTNVMRLEPFELLS